jgi:hypothetical protein
MPVKDSQLLRALPAIAFAPALLLPYAMLSVFESGVSERAEPIVLGAHACVALAAAAIAVRAIAGRPPAVRLLWLAAPAIAMAAWSLVVGFARGVPLTALFGTPQSGLGVLWYVDLALWLVLAGMVAESVFWWRRLIEACAVVHLCFALLSAGQFSGHTPFLFITTSWPALALPWMLLTHRGGRYWMWRVALVFCAAVVSLAAARSLTFIFIFASSAVLCGIVWRWGDRLTWLRSRRLGFGAVLIAALLPFALIASGLAGGFGASMRSRVLTVQMVMARLQESWDIWLFGLGWGRVDEAFALHLNEARAPLWDDLGWDFLHRDFFHSHNLLTEAALATGLPGTVLAVAIPAIAIWRAPAEKRPYATIFSFAWLTALGLWLELAFVLPLFALAMAALCHDEQSVTAASASRWQSAGGAVFAGLAGLLCIATVALGLQMASVDRLRAWLKSPQGAPPQTMDIRSNDGILVTTVNPALNLMKDRAANGLPEGTEPENRRLAWMLAALEGRMPVTRNPIVPITGNNVLSQIALNPDFAPLQPQAEAALTHWPRWLDLAMTLAPERSDLPIAYLTWRFSAGDERDVLLWAKRLRNRNLDDPVGLYFEGGVYVRQADPQVRRQGLALLRRALDNGVERFIPLTEDFKAQIRDAAG